MQGILSGALPVLPRTRFGVVDVRDVAEAHVRAMTEPRAAGRRIILTSGSVLTWGEVIAVLRDELGDDAGRIDTVEEGDDTRR